MKVSNTSIYVGQNERISPQQEEQRKSVFAGGLNHTEDSIFLKKQQAKQKALKIVGDTIASEQRLDEQQDARRENVKELTEQKYELRGYIEAQKDVPEEEMTTEMKEAQKEAISEYEKQYAALELEIKAENAVIQATKLERLKSSPMGEAHKAAEEIMEAASQEIVDMVMQDAKEYIDEKQEKREEQAEKLAEKREEEEERIAEAREEQQEAEAMAELVKQAAVDDTQKEIDEMLNKLKLLEEDIKGAVVDTIL